MITTNMDKSEHRAGPQLVDAGTQSYVLNALQRCHSHRVVIYYWIINVSVVVIIGCICATFVYLAMSKKMTPAEHRNKLIRDHEMVLNQIKVYKDEQQKMNTYTDLPVLAKHRGEQETPMR